MEVIITSLGNLDLLDLDTNGIRCDMVENLFFCEAMFHEKTQEVFHLISFGVDNLAFAFRKIKDLDPESTLNDFPFEPIAVMTCDEIGACKFECNFFIDPTLQDAYPANSIIAVLGVLRNAYASALKNRDSLFASEIDVTTNFFLVDSEKCLEYANAAITSFKQYVIKETMVNVLWTLITKVDNSNARRYLRNSSVFRETVDSFISTDAGIGVTATALQLVWGNGFMLDYLEKTVQDNPDMFDKAETT